MGYEPDPITALTVTVGALKEEVKALTDEVRKHFVTRAEFEPVKNAVYALVGATMLAVMGAILALVIKK